MSIHSCTRAADIHTFHMIFSLGTASQEAYEVVHLTANHKRTPKNSCQHKHGNIYHSILNIILSPADDKLSFRSKTSLNLTFAL